MPKIVLPKNKIAEDEKNMRYCFELAKRGAGTTAPNPMVGALIVHKNRRIGEGFTSPYGGAHAEVNAVNSVAEADRKYLAQATLYVSLEPCHHFGKTPPCVDLVLRCGFRRVVVCNTDPNPLVAGQSIVKMQAAGIEVVVGVLEAEGRALNAAFFTYFEKKRPHIILKWAQSADGFLGKPNEQIWLTSLDSKRLVHEWRSETMAIMVGANTILVDNPALTTRLHDGKSPLRISFFDTLPTFEIIKKWNIYKKDAPTIVFYYNKNKENLEDVTAIEHDFFKLIRLCCNGHVQGHCVSLSDVCNEGHTVSLYMLPAHSLQQRQLIPIEKREKLNFLNQILDYLYQNKINSLFVEGGANLLNTFINADLWDEMRVFVAPKTLENGIQSPDFKRLSEKCDIVDLGKNNPDKLYKYQNKNYK